MSDLLGAQNVPTFVRWDTNTANTPYKAGLTGGAAEGFAMVYGNYSTWLTAIAWVKGAGGSQYMFSVDQGNVKGWTQVASKDDLKSYFPDYYGSQITNDVMNLNNKLNGVWYGGVAGSTNNLPAGVKNALVRILKYSSSAVFLEVIDMDTGVRHSNLWQASAGWFGWK